MYPVVFEIRLDNDLKRYYAGQVVEGKVVVCIHKEKIVKGIEIRLLGKGNVYWDTGIKHKHVYCDSEVYVNKSYTLLLPEDGRQTILHSGTFEYFFSIKLPKRLPSSIEGQNCFIRYYLVAAIQRPWKDEQSIEKIIHVTSVSDLNSNPENALPGSFQKERRVGFNLCQAGPIAITFQIGKTGFVPGEYIQFRVEIRNTSWTRINLVVVSLKRLINCHAKGETKPSHEKLVQINGPATEVAGYLQWQTNFEIPNLPPSGLIGCQIISMQYYVEVKLVLEKWADMKFNMPITLGTIPFHSKTELILQPQIQPPLTTVEEPDTRFDYTFKGSMSRGVDEGQSASAMIEANGIFTLPPLDLTFFQTKPERHPHFSSYEDCDCEFPYPYRMVPSGSQEIIRPPRPHSNPGHVWEKSRYWENEDE